MSEEFGATAIVSEPRVAEADLSRRIEQAVPRDPLDRVKCVRVFDDFYRCNWWAHPEGGVSGKNPSVWSVVATQRVRKSQFLKAAIVAGELLIKELNTPGL